MNGSDYTKFVKNQQNKRGRPTEKIAQTAPNNLNLCPQCFSEIAQGKSHICVKTKKLENLAKLIRNTSERSKSNVMAVTLKEMAEAQGESTMGGKI